MAVLLPDICTIQYGFPFDSNKFSSSEGLPLIRIRDVVRGYSETYTAEKCGNEYIVNDGDILIGMDGEFNIAKWRGGKALLNQRVCRLFPGSNIDGGYLFYFMSRALKQIEEKTPFATVKHLSAKQLNAIEVPLPPIETQRQIAAVLDKVTALLTLRKQQLDKLEELAKARFVEMFGKGVPRVKPISDVVEQNISSARKVFGPMDVIKYVDISSIDNESNQVSGYTEYILKDAPSRAQQCIKKDDILISTVRPNLRNVARNLFCDNNVVASSGFCILRPFKCSSEYLFAVICSDDFTNAMVNCVTGANYPAIKDSDVLNYKIVIPTETEMNLFTELMRQIDHFKLTVRQGLDKLEMMKKALLQRYFG